MRRNSCVQLFASILCVLLSHRSLAQDPPSGFASTIVSSLWDEAVGIEFSEDGTEMWVWERKGKVWMEKNNQRQLILDISEEVGGYADHGLLGFALHPHFDENGYFYLLYVVDRHHLINYGTPAYNPATNDYMKATIGRLTRYTATKTVNGYFVNPSSRKVLIGETKTSGIVQTSGTHGIGSLVFGTDHTLMVSAGDGASPYDGDIGSLPLSNYAQALADGMITPTENVGVYRAQLLNTLSGKILRIDPETGAGIPSNPFYDPTRPNAPISKVWALGVRNPFRLTKKPGTGSHNPADGNPGTFYFGDVGWNYYEEADLMDKPGMNFGWPIYEGLDVTGTSTGYSNFNVANHDAPNPLYGVNGCTQQYFYFNDLLKHATPNGTATFTNPCNPAQPIPANIPTFVHTRPLIDWHHERAQTRTGTFNGSTPTVVNIGPGAPVTGNQFSGGSSVGGVLYTGTDFPLDYQNTYFFGDYSGSWIRNMVFDANNKPTAVRNFIDNNTSVVFLKTHPTQEGLYYVNFGSEIRKIYNSSNRPPIARASSDKTYGPSPFNVQFTGSTSTDPENMPLIYEWNFGDGSAVSTLANPTHTYGGTPGVPAKYTVTLKVTDNLGVANQTSLIISVNNTPPNVTITSPIDNGLYPITQETTYPLKATVSDLEHSAAQLTYHWQVILHHDDHEHPDQSYNVPEASALISPLGCDGQVYYYRILLTVTDVAGGSTTKEVKVYPDCNGQGLPIPVINWANPAAITQGTPLTATQLNATATHNGSAVPGTFSYVPPAGTVLPLGNTQQLTANFVPTNTNLFSAASKSVTINVSPASNHPPQLVLGMQDQSATVGVAFSFTVPSQTFTDQDAGTTLTYSAALSNGNPLPGWLAFIANTHTFSGTPVASDVGLLGIRVTVSDGQATADDVFALTVGEAAGPGSFYRAINVNGPALIIDNHNWEASATAQNFTYTTNQKGFANQAVTLIPATDANRATMIRSSIYGSNMTFNITSIPSGSYVVWIYVWEDNFSQTFTVTLEGAVVQANYASGNPGVWKKLGPFPVTINDGAINIGSTGQDANFSGIEIWTAGPPPANQPPVVALPIVDQNATAGTPFTFTFPSGTFSDPDAGTVLTYTSKLATDAPLPSWLTFNGGTRNFSGTPTASNVGPIDILVQAADGSGGIVSDIFTLSVAGIIPVAPVIAWANPAPITVGMALSATQLNATASYNGSVVAGTMTYTPAAGTVLGVGNAQTLSVNFIPTNTTLYTNASKSVTIDVNDKVTPLITWANPAPMTVGMALSATQLNATASYNGSAIAGTMTYTPTAGTVLGVGNAQTLSVIFTPTNTSLYTNASKSVTIDVNDKVTPLITWANPASITFGAALSSTQLNATATVNGSPVGGTFVYTPASGTVLNVGNGQTLNVNFTPSNTTLYNNATKSVVIDVTPVKVTPVISWNNPQAITYGTALGSTQLNATASYNGVPLTGVFTYTPGSGTVLNAGLAQVLSVTFQADNSTLYNPVTKTVNIDVNQAVGQSTFYRAINVNGAALVIDANNWEASATAPNFTYTTNQKGFANQSVTLIPPTDANRSTMIRSSIYGSNMMFNITSIPAGSYLVSIYVWEDNFSQTFTVTLEGVIVQANYVSGSPGTWKKLGPYPVTINDGAINIGSTGQDANFSGIEIWKVNAQGNNPPVVAQPIADQTTTAGSLFTFAFPSTTFTDPDAGTTLTYGAALSNGGALPAWLSFNSATRTFSGTPGSGDVSTSDIRVTASDGAGGSINDVFALTVNPIVKVTPIINWNNPSAITSGTALSSTQLNATATVNGAQVAGTFVYTPAAGTVLGVGNGQTLTVNFTPSNTTLYNNASKSVTIDVNAAPKVTPLITWNNPTAITSGTALSSTQLNATATVNGAQVAGTFVYTPAAGTVLGIGNGQVLTVNFSPSNTTLYNAANKSVTIDVNAAPKVTPLITWANPASITIGTALSSTQLNATATVNGSAITGTFAYNPTAGTVLNLGLGQPLSVTFTPANTTLYNSVSASVTIDVLPAAGPAFYRAINLNGPALVIDGNNWQAMSGAANFTYSTDRELFANQAVPLIPPTDANRAAMIRSSIWGVNVTLNLSVPTGNYQVYLYVWEDNNPVTFSVRVEGALVLSNYNSGPAGTWSRLGPYNVAINDGAINVVAFGGHANLSGLEVYTNPSGSREGLIASEENVTAIEQFRQNEELQLSAYPNPFSKSVSIEFSAPVSGPTILGLYDIHGVHLRKLFDGNINAGSSEQLVIESDQLSDGMYVLQLSSGGKTRRLKLALTR